MKKLILLLLLLFLVVGCSQKQVSVKTDDILTQSTNELTEELKDNLVTKEKLEGEVFYNIFPISFADSNNDGFGDLNGVTKSLDYLKQMGVKGIWLNPIHPSPSYHKYDVVDYYGIDPQFGTLKDFENLLKEAHDRDMVIIMDMVLNHSSSKHPWFEKSMNEEKGYEDYYIKVDSLDEIDVKDKSAWYKKGDKYYFGSFWSEMPEFNLESKAVRTEFRKILKFWLDLGVDGFRYDAAKHAYDINEYKTGTFTLDKNRQFWLEMKKFVKGINPEAYVVAEVWLDSKQMSHYVNGFDALFNFDFGEAVQNAINKQQSIDFLAPYSKFLNTFKETSHYMDAPFLSNHDQPRIASNLNGNINQLKLAASILLTIPGNPYIYYGEELGYLGVKPDERIREPFKWGDTFEQKQPRWETVVLNLKTLNVNEQAADQNSLLNHYRVLGKLRSENEILKKGTYSSLPYGDNTTIAYERVLGDQRLYVLHNLSETKTNITLKESGEILFATNDSSLTNQSVVLNGYSTLIVKVQP